MLATLVSRPFDKPGWDYEEKYDGDRMLAYKGEDRVRLLSRKGKDRTDNFPQTAAAVHSLRPVTLLLDGEVVVFDKKEISHFQLLQQGKGEPSGLPMPIIPEGPPITALDLLKLVSFAKTSGSRGLHVLVPIRVGPDANDVLAFAESFVARVAAAHPDELTVEHSIMARHGRVYLDPFRNGFGQTVVAPFDGVQNALSKAALLDPCDHSRAGEHPSQVSETKPVEARLINLLSREMGHQARDG
ncbi:MAG: hypothetical protein WCF30_12510 [Terracidiphilus sp.]